MGHEPLTCFKTILYQHRSAIPNSDNREGASKVYKADNNLIYVTSIGRQVTDSKHLTTKALKSSITFHIQASHCSNSLGIDSNHIYQFQQLTSAEISIQHSCASNLTYDDKKSSHKQNSKHTLFIKPSWAALSSIVGKDQPVLLL